MERLQKKCFFGSLATHAILVGVFMAGTAFMGGKTFKPLPMTEEVTINLINVDALTDGPSKQGGGGGGGSPAPVAAPPVQLPPPPVVQPPPKVETVKLPEPEPEPVVEVPKPKALEAISIAPPKKADRTPPKKAPTKPAPVKQEPTKIVVKPNLNTVVRGPQKTTKSPATTTTRPGPSAEDIRKEKTRQRDIATAIGTTFKNLDGTLSQAGTGLDIASFGAGSGKGWGMGSGPTLMNYAQYVREIYDLNWIVTDAVVGDSGIVRVEIVVQRNGAARGKIVNSSGNKMLDRTVQTALDRVKNIGRPFPEGATDSSRTFTINFNLTSKRGTG